MKKIFHKKGERDPSPVRDRDHALHDNTLGTGTNNFHIHGGQDTGFVVDGGQPLGGGYHNTSLGNTGAHQTSLGHSGGNFGHTSTESTHYDSSTRPLHNFESIERQTRPAGYVESYETRPAHYTDTRTSELSNLGNVRSYEQPYVEGLGMGAPYTQHNTTSGYSTSSTAGFSEQYGSSSHTGTTGKLQNLKQTLTSENMSKPLPTGGVTVERIEKVIETGKRIAQKIGQPKDIHVDQDKIGRPIEKTGETYQKAATKIVHMLHEGAHKLDAKLEQAEAKLSDPHEMQKHHERAQKLGQGIQNVLDKAQMVIDKVQDVSEQLEGKARQKGISPTRVKEQAKQHVEQMAQAGSQGGVKGIAQHVAQNLNQKVESSSTAQQLKQELLDKENQAPIRPQGQSFGQFGEAPLKGASGSSGPVKVETIIETRVTEANPSIPGQGIHMSNPLGQKQF